MNVKKLFLLFLFISLNLSAEAGQDIANILPLKERAKLVNRILEERVTTVLPQLMRKTEIDMWVVIGREYNEGPILKTFLSYNQFTVPSRSILIMFDPGGGKAIEMLSVGYSGSHVFKQANNQEKTLDQWQQLASIIAQRKPKKIAVNKSLRFGLADGIPATEYELLKSALPKEYLKKIVSAEPLAIGWLETRSKTEKLVYPQVMKIAHQIIATALSNQVITPGITSNGDLAWWLREKAAELNLDVWFFPIVSIQRNDKVKFDPIKAFENTEQIILPGDLIHVDFGITYLRLNTDTQQHAYVLKPGEQEAPAELQKALAVANRLQDIVTERFAEGKTGNALLKEARKKAIEEKIKSSIYSHPVGFHGHGAGPTIGLWGNQNGTPKGDYPIYLDTAYSIELSTVSFINSWNKDVRIMLEEDAMFTEQGINYLNGRQKKFLLINSPSNQVLGTN